MSHELAPSRVRCHRTADLSQHISALFAWDKLRDVNRIGAGSFQNGATRGKQNTYANTPDLRIVIHVGRLHQEPRGPQLDFGNCAPPSEGSLTARSVVLSERWPAPQLPVSAIKKRDNPRSRGASRFAHQRDAGLSEPRLGKPLYRPVASFSGVNDSSNVSANAWVSRGGLGGANGTSTVAASMVVPLPLSAEVSWPFASGETNSMRSGVKPSPSLSSCRRCSGAPQPRSRMISIAQQPGHGDSHVAADPD